jgi:hypothetical protein
VETPNGPLNFIRAGKIIKASCGDIQAKHFEDDAKGHGSKINY